MAKYQTIPVVATAYVIQSIGAADGDGNVTVQANDVGLAGTIPFVYPATETEGFVPGDFVALDPKTQEPHLVSQVDFNSHFIPA